MTEFIMTVITLSGISVAYVGILVLINIMTDKEL